MKYHQKQLIQNFPDSVANLPRRNFIKRLLGATAAAAVMPSLSFPGKNAPFDDLMETAEALSRNSVGAESFWRLVKRQFMIRDGLIMMNAANLCPSPYPVQQKVFELTRDVDKDPSYNNRGKFYEMLEKSRSALADYLGALPEEIAVTRNTTEGNNIVINGLTFRPGDEVVIWDENHPTANEAWDVRAERYGFTVKRVQTPKVFEKEEDLIQPFRDAVTPRTRILCFSHLSNLSGILLPAKEICRVAKDRNVLTHVDGAQTFGSLDVNLHDIGCDFYTGSAHKWFVGPKEVGVLFVQKERIPDLWPTIVGVGYQQVMDKGARKFETLGQRDDSRIGAILTTVEFHRAIGIQRIEARVRDLAAALMRQLKHRIPQVTISTPVKPELRGGIVIFNLSGADLNKALETLYFKNNLGCAVFGGELSAIRLCPHLYNTMEEVELAVDAVASLVGN